MNNTNTSIPKEILSIIESGEVYGDLEMIATKYGLNLDELGQLHSDTEKLMIGRTKSYDFSRIITASLGVSSDVANNIVSDINNNIFKKVRSFMQNPGQQVIRPSQPPTPTPTPSPVPIPKSPPKIQFQPLPTIQTPYKNPITSQANPPIIRPTIEQAGRFTLEKPPVGMPQYKESSINKENILKGIEDPTLTMVDHLLTTPVNTVEAQEIKKPVIESRPYTTDPYREEL